MEIAIFLVLGLVKLVVAVIAGGILAGVSLAVFRKMGASGASILLFVLSLTGCAIFQPAWLEPVLICGGALTGFTLVVDFVLTLKSQLKSG